MEAGWGRASEEGNDGHDLLSASPSTNLLLVTASMDAVRKDSEQIISGHYYANNDWHRGGQ